MNGGSLVASVQLFNAFKRVIVAAHQWAVLKRFSECHDSSAFLAGSVRNDRRERRRVDAIAGLPKKSVTENTMNAATHHEQRPQVEELEKSSQVLLAVLLLRSPSNQHFQS